LFRRHQQTQDRLFRGALVPGDPKSLQLILGVRVALRRRHGQEAHPGSDVILNLR
jgi:hypothetical protein